VKLPFKRLDPGAELPAQAHAGDAALVPWSTDEVDVLPRERALRPYGLSVGIPEGHAALVLPRSGLASRQGLTLANAPGLIDSGYRGEVTCAVVNLDRDQAVKIRKGDRIAQLVVVTLPQILPSWVDELPTSSRGEGGFGSTGA
jgi:dUTP pyrophosphatase